MALLLDTHILLWSAAASPRLPDETRSLILSSGDETFFSVASIWEVVIKAGLGRSDFRVDPAAIRSAALQAGLQELPIRAHHVLAMAALSPLHADPFDRVLIAQATAEDMQLLTADRSVAAYGPPVIQV